MKPKSVSALVYKVVDLERTVKWYEGLGFRIDSNDGRMAIAYLNWFSIEFHVANDIDESQKDGPLVLVSVELDAFYEAAVKAGYEIESEPQKTVNKRREFSMRDPNGYLMVFFEKK
ncbi:MAG TPA: VOC family protein [Candidatus Saccharimonadales bacterium]|nr:VOC family protein [Candidatus Saccharimonadales bacterium]